MSEITEFDYLTGQITTRQLTKEEKAFQKTLKVDGQEIIDQTIASEQLVYEKKQSAISKLMSLGLTEEEAKALAGI